MDPANTKLKSVEALMARWTSNTGDAGTGTIRALLGAGPVVRGLLGPGVQKVGEPLEPSPTDRADDAGPSVDHGGLSPIGQF